MTTATLITFARESDGVDLAVTDGFALLTNSDAAPVVVRDTFHLREGSSLYDDTAGFPYDETLGVVNPLLMASLLREHLKAIPVVDAVDFVRADNDENARAIAVQFGVTTIIGAPVALTFEV